MKCHHCRGALRPECEDVVYIELKPKGPGKQNLPPGAGELGFHRVRFVEIAGEDYLRAMERTLPYPEKPIKGFDSAHKYDPLFFDSSLGCYTEFDATREEIKIAKEKIKRLGRNK